MRRSIIAYLLALSPTLAWGDGIPIVPLPLPPPPAPYVVDGGPRHIYRDGQYFFCPYPDYDPYCRMPNDYSWALYGPPGRQRPPVISVPVPNSLLRNAPPQQELSVEQSREDVIRRGQEHCNRFPNDEICHFKDAPR